jgi:DNA repair exonuclease SbcCD ATPase subunit
MGFFSSVKQKWEDVAEQRRQNAARAEEERRRLAREREELARRDEQERKEREYRAWVATPQGAYVTRLEHALEHLMGELARLTEVGLNAATREKTLAVVASLKRLIASTKEQRQEFALSFSTYLSREAIVDVRSKFNRIIDGATDVAAKLREKAKQMKTGGSWSPPPEADAPSPKGAIFTKEQFNALLKAVHPDRARSASAAELNAAMSLLNTHKAALLGLNA